jgi:hypothetical protein
MRLTDGAFFTNKAGNPCQGSLVDCAHIQYYIESDPTVSKDCFLGAECIDPYGYTNKDATIKL